MPPFVSVIMPVFDGAFTLERALRSVIGQRFADWEIVAVDDGSTDDTWQILQRWAAADSRIRAVRLDENRGIAGARNAAIELAQGEVLAFLDRDDEYYPDYLANVRRLCQEADVLIFGYDYVYEDGPAGQRMPSWDPASVRQDLFLQNIVMPLGVAHWRRWWEKAGGFHEGSWQPDWDYWKRLVRAGARFEFPSLKSGRYHARPTGASRRAHITPQQQKMFLDNWRSGKPMYGSRPLVAGHPKARKIAFVSAHCAVDPTNGAATSTLDGLKLLQENGFDCQVFCCSHLDAQEEVSIGNLLRQYGASYELRGARLGTYEAQLLFTSHRKVPVTLFRSASSRQWASAAEQEAFLTACDQFLKDDRPDLVWTYGGDPSAYAIQRLAKRLDIPVLFALHNFSYFDPASFVATDYVIVFSEYSRQYYWDSIRLACQKFPLVVDPERVEVTEWKPQYVTFVNPEPRKGVFVFARIAEVLSRRRPDIPLLVVEGVAKRHWLPQLGIDFSRLTNLRVMPTTPHPRDFYAVSKILLMPSLAEPAGLVAMEGMFNGIPVLAGKRGGLTEIVGEGGFLFEIPTRCTVESCVAPTAEEVEPWVETVIRLWDDKAYFEEWSQRARERARLWHPDRLKPVYREFFENVFVQPAPPLVP
jgi:glycosyltransferase involved in cell wall biosynthesis